jgi:hypothetical protein
MKKLALLALFAFSVPVFSMHEDDAESSMKVILESKELFSIFMKLADKLSSEQKSSAAAVFKSDANFGTFFLRQTKLSCRAVDIEDLGSAPGAGCSSCSHPKVLCTQPTLGKAASSQDEFGLGLATGLRKGFNKAKK